MCGIFGAIGFKQNPNNIFDSLQHRGPDNSGIYKNGSLYLAHTRLSIIDPISEANQPMSFDGLVVIFNGEIYNYKELKRVHNLECKTNSDTEVILRLYQKYGISSFGLLDGMFAFALWDTKTEKLFLARDSIGEKPLYYVLQNNRLIFSSKIEAILISGLITPTLNYQAIYDLLTFGFIPEPQTIINEIIALKKGSYLEFDGKNVIFGEIKLPEIDLKSDLIFQTRELVTKSIKDRLISDVPLGTFLSGGLDSTLVSILASKELKEINTFNIAFEDDIDPYHGFADESSFAREVAKQIGSMHHEIRVKESDFKEALNDFISFCDQPFGSISSIGIMLIAKKARELGIKVLLSGDGADEIFGGYSWHLKVAFNDSNAFSQDKPKGWHYYGFDSEKRLFLSTLFNECQPSIRYLITNYKKANPKEFLDLDREFYLPNEMMVKLDRMCMAHSIEGRAAFVSPNLLAFSRALSYEQIFFKREQKALLKAAFADLIPEFILKREKHGFNPPIAYWISNSWRELLFEALDETSMLKKYGIIEDGSIFLKLLEKNPVRLAITAFCLIVLNMWLKKYDSYLC